MQGGFTNSLKSLPLYCNDCRFRLYAFCNNTFVQVCYDERKLIALCKLKDLKEVPVHTAYTQEYSTEF